MAKFLKSFFTPEKRKGSKMEGDEEGRNDFTPPLDGRRNLSISRSGRMRQANKKRSSLALDLYGEKYQQTEMPKSREYHVNNPMITAEPIRRRSLEDNTTKPHLDDKKDNERRTSADLVRTPEEEIELAFEIIDKVL